MYERMLVCSIMQLDTAHLDEICADIREQYESGIANYPMFMMPLVPEGTPPVDKAGQMVKRYLLFRDKLRSMGIKSGILVQCSIGHGYPLNSPSPFTKYVNLNDGAVESVCCPFDDAFCAHFKGVMRTLAAAEPDLLMLDDDFRLIFRGGNGCACGLHMARFNELAGTSMTREELFEILKKDNDGAYAKLYIQTQGEALLKAARAMREGIDEVNPSLNCVFCAAGNNAECAVEISEILAGKGNPTIVRISNGTYTPPGTRKFTRDFYRAAIQIAQLQNRPKYVLAESDTCPQNRYACSAQWFHAHYVGSLLEGTQGAKHWITRLDCYEPESGVAYRKILKKNAGLYERLSALVPTLKWQGCRVPLSTKKRYFFSENGWASNNDGAEGWVTHVLDRMGLPVYFSAREGGVAFLAGEVDRKLSHEELKELLQGPVVMSSDVAQRLCARGFSEHLGVRVEEWTGLQPTLEVLFENGQSTNVQVGARRLIPLSEDVEILSEVYNTVDRENLTPLFPGCTRYKNLLGGTVVVYCGTPITAYNYVEAFAFYTYSRKLQFIRILRDCGCLPIYYTGDEEVYCKAARTTDGALFCALFNLSYDTAEEISLFVEHPVHTVQMLSEKGETVDCRFRTEGDRTVVEVPLLPLNPVMLFIK